MEEILKKILTKLEKNSELIKENREMIKSEVSSVKDEVSSVKDEVSIIKNEVSSVKDEVSSVKNEVSSVKDEVSIIKNEVNSVNKRLDSHYTLLKSLEGRTESRGADIDSIAVNVAKLLGKADRISNQSRLALSNTAANRLDIDSIREDLKELKKGG